MRTKLHIIDIHEYLRNLHHKADEIQENPRRVWWTAEVRPEKQKKRSNSMKATWWRGSVIIVILSVTAHWARACQLTVAFCLQTEVNDHLTSVVGKCVQGIESISYCWLSRSELPLQINSYQISHFSGLAPIPNTDQKFLLHLGLNQHHIL